MARSQKVGVLTFHRCINYGSYWQARCLVEGLQARGDHVVLLDHHSPRVNRAEWKCALQPTLPHRPPREDYPRYAAKTRKFFESFAALPLSAPFPLEDPAAMEPMDVAVIGSDEVWNFRHPWYAGYPIFFGDGLRAERVVSYAASFGAHDAAHGIEDHWADRLRRFAGIGVRDDNSRRLVQDALGVEPALVLDPCLQFADVCRRPSDGEADAPVIVYGHGFPAWFAERARAWADARGHRLVSLGYRNDWADEQRLDAGPEEFAQAMGAARAVITNFFHGCVFALVNEKPFVTTLSDYRSNKVAALMRKVGAERHLIAEHAGALEQVLDAPLDPAIPATIAELRRRSEAYLDAVLA